MLNTHENNIKTEKMLEEAYKKHIKEKKKNKYESYYDGHYIDSGLPQKERDRIAAESMEKNKELKGWPDPNE